MNVSREVHGHSEPSFRVVAEGSGSHCFLCYTCHGIFLHRFQLRAFPFDTQTLLIQSTLWRSPLERVVRPASRNADGTFSEALCQPFRGRVTFHMSDAHMMYEDGFIQKDVYNVHFDTAVHVRAGHTDERHRGVKDGQRFSTLTVEISIKRRFEFYALNVILMYVMFGAWIDEIDDVSPASALTRQRRAARSVPVVLLLRD